MLKLSIIQLKIILTLKSVEKMVNKQVYFNFENLNFKMFILEMIGIGFKFYFSLIYFNLLVIFLIFTK